jgi:NADPH-dependent 2,4-dienoyl-CoA reductase/sulfur reductase-like enzyme
VTHHRYLIVGGGMCSDAAVRGIREVDPSGDIAIVGAEADPPYKRPPLSKGLWKGDPLEKIWYGTESRGARLYPGRTVAAVDPVHGRVECDGGESFTYERLLLATGGSPRRFPFDDGGVVHFRTVADYRRLRALAERGKRFAVVGGGFIGSEIAAALATNGKEVVLLFPGEGIGGRVFPPDLSRFLNDYYREKGVEVRPGASVTAVEREGEAFTLRVEGAGAPDGGKVVVDGVVAGLGIEPNVSLASAAGLAVDNGIAVDEFLRTSRPEILAAGDAASFPSRVLGKRVRVEHEDNAKAMGKAAGRAMAGAPEPYLHLPFFYSDLFDLGYEAVGELDPRLDVVADWREPFRKGVVYYLRDGRVRGVLLWNVWERVEAARTLIAEAGPFRREDLFGRITDPA